MTWSRLEGESTTFSVSFVVAFRIEGLFFQVNGYYVFSSCGDCDVTNRRFLIVSKPFAMTHYYCHCLSLVLPGWKVRAILTIIRASSSANNYDASVCRSLSTGDERTRRKIKIMKKKNRVEVSSVFDATHIDAREFSQKRKSCNTK
jgi:hypothetical protein